ncbi:unnamed protein product [Periconia digitata]|uniref:RRM domain-containing protein n=1 Tax=Periconia digitata TaxID=1303443 RepID=A0A9W4UNQ6_9PLEO|nr:unnamed protein product [Periconia digitata]
MVLGSIDTRAQCYSTTHYGKDSGGSSASLPLAPEKVGGSSSVGTFSCPHLIHTISILHTQTTKTTMAAEDLKGKKRKGASEPSPKSKKQKKTEEPAQATRKSTRVKGAAVVPTDSPAATEKPARKRAEDFFSDDETAADATASKSKKAKKAKLAAQVDVEDVETKKPKKKAKKDQEPAGEPAAEEEVSVKKSKKSKKSKDLEDAPVKEVEEVAVVVDEAEDEEDLDDQTAALLAGFESDRDESDAENEGETFDEDAVSVPKLSKKQQKALEKARKDGEPGVVFLGRIPHGFFEPQMKKYFSQFGQIKRLRLSRNKKTGASKHYAFIEFAHGDVAEIVAKTMQNYLMFGHILQCKIVPAEQVHPDLFKGANQRFKIDPRNKKAGAALARGATRPEWEKRIKNENSRRIKQAAILEEEFGYKFEAPAVKPVESVPRQDVDTVAAAEQQLQLEAPTLPATEVVKVIESTPDQVTVSETVKVKKSKKSAKSAAEPDTNGAAEPAEEAPAPKAKKDKKRKSTGSIAEAAEEPIPSPATKKAKKAKKAKA